MWYAKINASTAIATGSTYRECSDAALATGIWDSSPGSHAPYYITTMPPTEELPE